MLKVEKTIAMKKGLNSYNGKILEKA